MPHGLTSLRSIGNLGRWRLARSAGALGSKQERWLDGQTEAQEQYQYVQQSAPSSPKIHVSSFVLPWRSVLPIAPYAKSQRFRSCHHRFFDPSITASTAMCAKAPRILFPW